MKCHYLVTRLLVFLETRGSLFPSEWKTPYLKRTNKNRRRFIDGKFHLKNAEYLIQQTRFKITPFRKS